MILEERQKHILNEVIREYIRLAKPVSSQEISENTGFKMSSATIRSELVKLEKSGYLEQPHTSAGRIPTDLGYRFFVDNLLDDIYLSKKEEKLIQEVFSINALEDFLRGITKLTSDFTNAFVLGGMRQEDIFTKTGFSRILDEPEFKDNKSIKSFGQLVDKLDEHMEELLKEVTGDREAVFIGEENPVEENNCLAMLVSRWEHPRGQKGFIAILGPKRMDYQKNISFLRYINNNF